MPHKKMSSRISKCDMFWHIKILLFCREACYFCEYSPFTFIWNLLIPDLRQFIPHTTRMNTRVPGCHLSIRLGTYGKLLKPFRGRNSSSSEVFPFMQALFAFFIKGQIIIVSSKWFFQSRKKKSFFIKCPTSSIFL